MDMTIAEALRIGAQSLRHGDSPRLEAELLLDHLLQRGRAFLYAHPEHKLSNPRTERYLALVKRRERGEPMAYITGRREFWSLDLGVDSHTLIPRPETELLVDLALARIPLGAKWRIADLGTGCGAIALAIASERPSARVTATDISPPALAIAEQNALRLGIGNVLFAAGSWFEGLARIEGGQNGVHTIVSNPPYIPHSDPHLGQGDLRYEPRAALAAGADGLDALRLLTREAPRWLRPGGWLLLEHGYDQGSAVLGLLRGVGFTKLEDHSDLGGQPRVAVGQWV